MHVLGGSWDRCRTIDPAGDGSFGSLVGATNGLSRHPNPFGVTVLEYLKELGVPCSPTGCSICPLRTRLLVDDVVAHLSCWNSGEDHLVVFLHGLEVDDHSASVSHSIGCPGSNPGLFERVHAILAPCSSQWDAHEKSSLGRKLLSLMFYQNGNM